MQTREMSDEQLMDMMATYVSILHPMSNWSRNEFFSYTNRDVFLELGVGKAVELVGEAASYVSQAGRNRYNKIDFDLLKELRTSIVHSYENVLLIELYQTISRDIPELRMNLIEYGFMNP